MKTNILLFALLSLVGCKSHDEHFTGDIHHVDIDIQNILEGKNFPTVHLSPVMQTQNDTEGFLVCDSLVWLSFLIMFPENIL